MQKYSISKTSTKVSFIFFISHILGFFRDVLMAMLFGTGLIADAFWMSFRIPNILRRFVGEGGIPPALVPVYTEIISREDKKNTEEFLRQSFTFLLIILFIITLTGVIFSDYILKIFAFKWIDIPEKFNISVDLLRILFPYVLFISIGVFWGAILNSYGKFTRPASASILMNIIWLIACVIVILKKADLTFSIYFISIAIVFSGLLQMIFQFPSPYLTFKDFSIKVKFNHPALKKVIKLVIPAAVGTAVYELNILVDMILASTLKEGSVSALTLGNRIVLLPIAIIGTSIATVTLPRFSKDTLTSKDEFYKNLISSLKMIYFIILPVQMWLIFLSKPIIVILFQRGAFTSEISTKMTASALLFYSIGLFAYNGVKILAQAFYAQQDTKTPVKIASLALFVNIIFDIILIFPLKHNGLAFATSIASITNLFILSCILKKIFPEFLKTTIIDLSRFSIVSFSIISIVSFLFFKFIDYSKGIWNSIILVILVVIISSFLYLVIAKLLKWKETQQILNQIKTSRFLKK